MNTGDKLFSALSFVSSGYIDEALNAMQTYKHTAIKRTRKPLRGMLAAAVIAALLIALGAAAYGLGQIFSRGTHTAFEANAAQQQELVESGMATVFDTVDAGMSVTVNGVTITPLDVVADENTAFVTFAVDGFVLKADEEPGFEAVLSVGDDMMNLSGGFAYTQPTDERESTTDAPVYADENGRLEFTLTLWPSGEGYSLLGKTVCVRFVNLGIACKVSTTPVINGEWVFEIELPSESGARECFLNKPVGDTGFAINKVTISPLSVCVAYSTPADVQIKGDELGTPMFRELSSKTEHD